LFGVPFSKRFRHARIQNHPLVTTGPQLLGQAP
jgi:hypothetical protein